MKRILKRIFIFIIMILLFCATKVNASVTSTDPTTTSGGEVTITLKSTETVYAYKITLADSGGLTFKSATSTAGQINGTTVNGASASGVTTLATYTFKVPEVSTTTSYSVKFSLSISTDGETYQSTSNTSKVTVTIPTANPSTTQSSDATLKSITVGDKTYSGSSLKNTITHTVPLSVSSIKISAVKNNSKATVSGISERGTTKSLIAGQTNQFKITVTAENGTKKTYTVNIIRLPEESNVPNVIDEEVQNPEEVKLMLTSLVIKDVDLNPEFNSEVYNYTANVQNIKELEIDATASKTDAIINIEGAKELKEGENIVKITVILGEETVEYIINVHNSIEEEIVGATDDNNNNDDKNNYKTILLIAMNCLLGIIAIRYMSLSYKLSKGVENKKSEDEEYDMFSSIKNQNIAIETGKSGKHY